eukprot:scaffold1921_cov355-Chaetoceros_neogracile.AAC.1
MGRTVVITGSKFVGNTAAGVGGAIFNHGGTMVISASEFIDNTAQIGAGAIFNYAGSVVITGSKFIGNTARGGGAIRNEEGKIVITDSEFEGNTASEDGGNNIYNIGGDLTCDDGMNTFESPDVTSLANDSQGNYPADICAS